MGILEDNLDQFFLIIMGLCLPFMQSGFALLEAGSVRSKNVTNILTKNVSDSFICGVSYWLFGFALAYGDGNQFIGYKYFAITDLPANRYGYFFFQFTFTATATTILSGAMAERCEFMAYFIFSFIMTGFIYPLVTHWTWWPEGFLVKGIDYGGDIGRIGYQCLAWQLTGMAVIMSWTAFWSAASFGVMKWMKILRVPEEIELKGYTNMVMSFRELNDKGPYEHPEIVAVARRNTIAMHEV